MKKFCMSLFSILATAFACIGCVFLASPKLNSSNMQDNASPVENASTYAEDSVVTPTVYWYIGGGELILSSNSTAEFPEGVDRWAYSGNFASSTSYTGNSGSRAPYYSYISSIQSIRFEGTVVPTSMSGWFYNLNQVKSINFTNLETSHVTSWYRTFASMTALTEIDISGLNLSNVTTFELAFSGSNHLTRIITKDAQGQSAPKGQKATSFASMFSTCSALEEVDLSVFTPTAATNLNNMFASALLLKSIDLSNFQLATGATATGLTSNSSEIHLNEFKFNRSIASILSTSTFPTPTTTAHWFYQDEYTTFKNGDEVGSWAVEYFNQNPAATSVTIFNPNSAKLYYAVEDGVLTISSNAISSTSFTSLLERSSTPFSGLASSVTSIRFDGLVRPASMSYWFRDFTAVTSIDFTNLDTRYTTSLCYTFGNLAALESLDMSSLNFQNLVNGSYMFYNNAILKSVNLKNKTFPNLTNAQYMFGSNPKLEEVDLTGFVAPNVTNTSYMFYNDIELKRLDLHNFATPKTTTVQYMFSGLTNLEYLDVSSLSLASLNFSSSSSYRSLFSGFSYIKDFRISESVAANMSRYSFGNRTPSSTNPWYYVNDSQSELPVEDIDVSLLQDQEKTAVAQMNQAGRYINIITPVIYWGYQGDTKELVLSATPQTGTYSGNYLGSNVGAFTYAVTTDGKTTTYNLKTEIKSIRVEGNITVGALVSMFSGYTALTSVDLTGMNTICVKDMSRMFESCSVLTNVNINSLDVRFTTNFSSMFTGCLALVNLDLSGLVPANVTALTSMFSNCQKLENVNLSTWRPTNVISLASMFTGCTNLKNVKFDNFATPKATTTYQMFQNCTNLETLDLSAFDTSSVTNFSYMFEGCRGLKNLNISSFNTSSGTDFSYMFRYVESLRELDLRHFDTSKATTFRYMLYAMTDLRKLDISTLSTASINTTKVSNAYSYVMGSYSDLQDVRVSADWATHFGESGFLFGAQNPTTTNPWYYIEDKTDNAPLEEIDITTLPEKTNIGTMKAEGRYVNVITPTIYWGIDENGVLTLSANARTEETNGSFRGNAEASARWASTAYIPLIKSVKIDGTITIGTTAALFRGLTELVSVDLTGLNTICVKTMAEMFNSDTALKNVNLGTLNVKYVTSFTSMFANCKELEYIDLSKWNPSSAVNLSSMFANCTNLKTVNFGKFATPNATLMSYMFQNCTSLASLDLSGFDVSKVTSFSYMFDYCSAMKSVNLSSFVTSSGTDFSYMFRNCTALEKLDLTSFDTSKGTNFRAMFLRAYGVESLDLSSFSFASVNLTSNSTAYSDMFSYMNELKDLKISAEVAVQFGAGRFNFNTAKTSPASSNPWYYVNDDQAELAFDKIDIRKLQAQEKTAANQLNQAGRYILPITKTVYWAITNGELVLSADESLVGNGELRGNFDGGSATTARWNYTNYIEATTSVRFAGPVVLGYAGSLFEGLTGVESIDLTGLNLLCANTMAAMFARCSSLKNINFEGVETQFVSSFNTMFSGCTSLEYVDLSSFDTSMATNMNTMFASCYKLKTLDLSSFNTSKVINFESMFDSCYELASINLSSFDTTSATTFRYMFRNCYALKELDLKNFKSPKVTTFEGMFRYCQGLEKLNISQLGLDDSFAVSSSTFNYFLTSTTLLRDITISEYFAKNPARLNLSRTPSSTNYWYYINDEQVSLPLDEIDYLKYNTRITAISQFNQAGRYICPLSTYVYWAITNGELVLSATPIEGEVTGSYLGSRQESSSPFAEQAANIKSVRVNGKVVVGSLYYMFRGLTNLVSVDLTGLDTGNVTSMQNMFDGCTSLKNANLNTLNVSYVQNFSSAFQNCTALTSLDLSNWVTSAGVYFGYMFYQCTMLEEVKLTKFDTANATNLSFMFRYCNSLKSLDLSSFDTSKVTTFAYMFGNCKSLKTLNVKSFTGIKANTVEYMFGYCSELEELDLANFETSDILVYVTGMFRDMASLRKLNIPKISFTKASSRSYVFSGLYSLKEIIISESLATQFKNTTQISFPYPSSASPWFFISEGDEEKPYSQLTPLTSYRSMGTAGKYVTNTDYYVYWKLENGELVLSATPLAGETTGKVSAISSYSSSPWANIASQVTSIRVEGKLSVGSMAFWFNGFINARSIDLTGLDTSTTNSLYSTFNGCSSLTTLKINNLDVNYVTSFAYAFQNCSSLTSLDISNWKGVNATSTAYMFAGCSNLQSVTFGQFGGEKITDMSYMFYKCSSIREIDLTGFNPTSLKTMYCMFHSCSAVTNIDLSSFVNTSQLTNMSYTFYGCTLLQSVDLKTVNTDMVTTLEYAFYKCSSLKVVDLSTFKAQKLTAIQYMFYHCVSLVSLDLSSFELTVYTGSGSSYYRNSFVSLNALQEIRASEKVISMIFARGVGLNSIISSSAPWYERDAVTNAQKITSPNQMKANTWYRNPFTAEIYWFVEDDTLTITSLASTAEGKEGGVFLGTQAYTSNGTPWNAYKTTIKKVVISGTVTPASTAYWFEGFSALQDIDLTGLVTDTTTSIAYMFNGCTALTYLDISTLNMSTITAYSYFLNNLKTCNTIIINSQQAGKMVNYGFVVQVPMYSEKLEKDITKAQEMTVDGGYFGGIKVTFTNGKGWNKIASVSHGNRFDIDSIDFSTLPIPEPDEENHIMYVGLDKWLYADGSEVDFTNISGNITVYASYSFIKFQMPEGELVYNTLAHNISVENPFGYEYTLSYFYNPSEENGIFNPVDSTVNAGYYYARLTVGSAYVDSAVYHITPISITVEGITAENKVFDQSFAATLSTSGATVTGVLEADRASLQISATGRFADANVGENKTVSITDISTGNPNYVVNLEASQKETTASIFAKDIEGLAEISGVEDKTYTASDITQNFTVTVEGKRLIVGTDYTVSYTDNLNSGEATIEISGQGNYTGIASTTFNILKKNIASSDVSATVTPVVYTGEEITNIEIGLTYGSLQLTGDDYNIISFANNTNAGTATVNIEGAGRNFEGNKTITFRINQLSLADCEVVFDGLEESYQYDGSAVNPDYTLVVNGKDLEKNKDYTSFCVNNSKPGHATIRVTGKGNYTGVVTQEFSIVASDFKDCTISFEHDELLFNGTSQKQEPVITDKEGQVVDSANYKLSYSADTINAGTVTVTITGLASYLYSEATATYKIIPITLADAEVGEIASQVYNRKEQQPTLSVVKNGRTLTAGSDYTIAYENNTNVGTASVTITGQGNYFGSLSSTFEIVEAEITSISLRVKQVYFNGTAQLPTILDVKAGSFVLNQDEYEVIYLNEDNSIYQGDFVDAAVIKVQVSPKTGNRNFTGAANVNYTIRPAIISSISLSVTQVSFNGQENRPVVTKVSASNGYLLNIENGDYVLEYYRADELGRYDETISTTDFISAGKIKVTAKPKSSNFTSSASAIFEITKLSIQDPNVTIKYYFVDENNEEILDDEGNRTYMVEDQVMPGRKVVPEVSYNGAVVSDDYYTSEIINLDDIEDASFTSIGRYKIVVTGKGSFTGSVERTYKINPRPFTPESIEIVLNKTEFVYNGLPQTYDFDSNQIEVYDISDPENRIKLNFNEHFELADGNVSVQYGDTSVTLKPKDGYIANINAGTATLVLKGMDGKYSEDVIIAHFTITQRDISDCTIEEIKDLTYNGALQEPEITITITIDETTSVTLTKGTDFTVSFEDNLNAGIGFATIKGINNFVGSTNASFTINAKDLADSDIVVSGLETVSFNGKEQEPSISIVYKTTNDDIALQEDDAGEKDFVVIFSSYDFVNPSEITVYLFGTNNYTGSLELTYTIDRLALTEVDLFDKVYTHQYDGLPYDLLSKVIVNFEYDELQEDGSTQKVSGVAEKSGYKLFYQLEQDDGSFGEKLALDESVKFINAGKIRISVEASEESPYKTTTELYVDFEITAFALTDENLGEIASVEFTGEELTPEVVVTFNETVLKKDVDYTLAYENNINVSTEAVLKVIGKGSYKGTVSKTFEITPKNIGFADITIINDELIYNGTNQSLSGENISLELDGITLEYGKDFDFEYEEGVDRIFVGSYKFSAIGKGNYEGTTIKYDFNIVPRDLATLTFGEFEPVQYTGKLLTPEFELIDNFGNTKMIIGSDVVLSYGDASTNVNVAWARRDGQLVVDSQAIMILSAGTSGNYTGMAIVYFAIAPVDLATDARIEVDPITGIHVLYEEPIKIIPTVKFNNGQEIVTLGENTFNYAFKDVDKAGEATVTIVAFELSNFIGQKDVNYTILDPNARPDLADAVIEDLYEDVEYDGSDKTPDLTQLKVYMDGKLLTYGEDYYIEYSSANDYFVNVGKKELNIVAVKNSSYKGSQKVSFRILGIDDQVDMFLYRGSEDNKLSEWTYNQYNVSEILLSVTTASGRTPIIEYFKVNDDGSITSIEKLENQAGTYFIRATIKEDGNYRAIVVDHYFTINPIEITFSGVKAENKVYDGSDEAVMNIDGLRFVGVIGDDEVSLTAKLVFEDANAGENKTVYITNVELIGANAKNYKLAETGCQTETTASISKRTLVVILNIPNASMVYIKVEEVDYDVEGFNQSTAGILRLSFTNQDGEVIYTMPQRVGSYDISIEFYDEIAANNYAFGSGSVLTGKITIAAATISASNVLPIENQEYTGSEITPEIIIMYEGVILEKDVDYELAYSNNIEVGTATIAVTCKGNFTGSFNVNFTIFKPEIEIENLKMQDWVYGAENIPTPTYNAPEFVKFIILYSVGANSEGEYTSEVPTEVGSYFVKVQVEGDPDIFEICGFKILPKTLNATIETKNYVYGQNVIAPTITLDGIVGDDEVNFTIRYVCEANGYNSTEIPTEVGEYTIVLTSENDNYTISGSSTFTISILEAEVVITLDNWMYGDSPNSPSVTLMSDGEQVEGIDLTFEFVYSDSEDGEYSETIPTKAGTYYVKAVFENNKNYQFTQTPISFEITPRVLTITRVTAESKVYDGTTDATVTISNITGLVDGDDVVITARGRFSDKNVNRNKVVSAYDFLLSGEDAGNYVIAESGNRNIANASIIAREITASITASDFTYSQPEDFAIAIVNGVDGDENILGYVYEDSEGNITRDLPTKVGSYKVTLEVKDGNYTLANLPEANFTITPYELTADMVSKINDQIMTGEEVTPEITITFNGETLILNQDFTVTYSDNVEAGKAIAHITGIGNFTGAPDVEFNIVDISVYVEVEGYEGEYDGQEHDAFSKQSATNADGSEAEGVEWKYIYNGETFTEMPKFKEIGEYEVEYIVKDTYGKETGGTIKVVIKAVTIKDIVINGYEGSYDGLAHAAVDGEMTCTTFEDTQATWTFSTDSGDEKVYGEMPTFKDFGTYTVYFKISAENHTDYLGEITVTISKAELTITANNKTVVEGKPMPELTYKLQGLAEGEAIENAVLNFAITCDYTETAVTGDEFDIILSGEALGNYNVTFVNGKLTVSDKLDIITIVEGSDVFFAAPNDRNVLTKVEDRTTYDGEETLYLTGLQDQLTWGDLLEKLVDNDDITAVDASGKALTANSLVGTGTVITKGEDQITVVLLGDLNGDGRVNMFDKTVLQTILEEMLEDVSPAVNFAADVNKDGRVNMFDKAVLQTHLEEIVNIFEPEEEVQTVVENIVEEVQTLVSEPVEIVEQVEEILPVQEIQVVSEVCQQVDSPPISDTIPNDCEERVKVVYDLYDDKKYYHKKKNEVKEENDD